MNWQKTVEKSIGHLHKISVQAEDALVREWAVWAIKMAAKIKSLPLGSVHDEQCDCGANHDSDMIEYFYHFLGSPMELTILGYSPYIPGETGLRLHDLKKVGLFSKLAEYVQANKMLLDSPVIVSTPERADYLAKKSSHPLKNKLPVNTYSLGHVGALVMTGASFICDVPVFNKWRTQGSLLPAFLDTPPDKDTPELEEEIVGEDFKISIFGMLTRNNPIDRLRKMSAQ